MSAARPGLLTRVRAAIASAIAPKPRGRSAFAGGFNSRLTSDWIFAGRRSAKQDTLTDMRVVRDRAREMVRNSPLMARFVQMVAENVVGPYGIRLQAKNMKKDGSALFDEANDQIEAAWEEWCRPENCDAARRQSLTELLSLAVSGQAMDGELMIRLRSGTQPNGWGLSLQLLDPDLLDETWNRPPEPNLNAIYQGVEIDAIGVQVAYWMWTRHPTDPTFDRERVRIPADEIIFEFESYRQGQVRGMSRFAPIMQQAKMLDGYHEAELVAARVASATMATIELDKDAPAPDASVGTSEIPMEVEPGAMLRLGQGEKLAVWHAEHPSGAFGEFTRTMLHMLAAGLGVSYMTLTGDLSQTSYSSGRMGMIAERDHWKREQRKLIEHVLDRVYRRWIRAAIVSKKDLLPALDYDATRWYAVKWQARGFVSVDPMKETEAALLEINAGTKSLTQLAAEAGRDLEEVIAERKMELEMFKAAGVPTIIATSVTEKNPASGDASADAPADTSSTPPARELTVHDLGARALAKSVAEQTGALRDLATAMVAASSRAIHIDVAAPAVHVSPPDVTVNITRGAPRIVRDTDGRITGLDDAPPVTEKVA